jgi:hypothetical protein
VTDLVAPTVGANVSSMATDAITYFSTRQVSNSITGSMGPQIQKLVTDGATAGITENLDVSLTPGISDMLNIKIPRDMSRSLPLHLSQTLSNTVPHAVTSTMTHSLQDLRFVQYFCSQCANSQGWCDYCKMSNKNYYSTYYSTYFTDHYSKYYRDYYGKSLENVDKEMFDVNGGGPTNGPTSMEQYKAQNPGGV